MTFASLQSDLTGETETLGLLTPKQTHLTDHERPFPPTDGLIFLGLRSLREELILRHGPTFSAPGRHLLPLCFVFPHKLTDAGAPTKRLRERRRQPERTPHICTKRPPLAFFISPSGQSSPRFLGLGVFTTRLLSSTFYAQIQHFCNRLKRTVGCSLHLFARPTDSERWLFVPNKLLALSKGRRQDASHARAAQKLHYEATYIS